MTNRPELQVVSLSFLDLLSCSFGAVIILVLLILPGARNSNQTKIEWVKIKSGVIFCPGNYEDVLISIVPGNRIQTDAETKSKALPLAITQTVNEKIRLQFMPRFKPGRKNSTKLSGVLCTVYSPDGTFPELRSVRAQVYSKEHRLIRSVTLNDLADVDKIKEGEID